MNTGQAPTNDLEAAIVVTLAPGLYTAILSGNGGTTGIGLVEIYDLDQAGTSRLGNLSTRAGVGSGDSVVIAGFILGPQQADSDVIIRGLGPSLSQHGVTGALADPTLELHDVDGNLIKSNDNWQDNPTQAARIRASGLAPDNPLEAAIELNLAPGTYTAILGGNGETGIGLVEVFNKQ